MLPGQLDVKYDPEYEKLKKAQQRLQNRPIKRPGARGIFGSRLFSTGRGPVPTTRPGWDTDTEHKEKSSKIRPTGKPRRNNF